jgi:hypothetical protein
MTEETAAQFFAQHRAVIFHHAAQIAHGSNDKPSKRLLTSLADLQQHIDQLALQMNAAARDRH